MKHIIKLFYILTLCLLFTTTIDAQSVRVDVSSTSFAPSLKPDEKVLIQQKLDSLMSQYAKVATLFDPQKKKVTDASASAFYKVFTPNAQLLKDYEEFTSSEKVDPKAYANKVFNFLLSEGVKFKIDGVTLKEVVEDNKDFYVAKLTMSKIMYSTVTARGESKTSTGRVLQLNLKVDIPKSDFARMKITEIFNNKVIKQADDYVRYLNITPSFSKDLGNAPLTPYFTENHPTPTTLAINASAWTVGADFMTNKFSPASAKKKALFVGGGLRVQQQTFRNKLENFSLSIKDFSVQDSKGNEGTYLRQVDSLNLSETSKFLSIQLPVGASYRFMKGRKSAVMLNFRLVPGFILSGSNTIAESQTAVYDGKLDGDVLRILEQQAFNTSKPALEDIQKLKPFDVGKQTITTGAQGENLLESKEFGINRFSFAISISPSFYYDLRDDDTTWGIMGGIDINYQVTSPFKKLNDFTESGAGSEPFVRSYGYKNALPSYYSSGVAPLSIGFRVGIYQKLQKRP
jgi:hypothetical protein